MKEYFSMSYTVTNPEEHTSPQGVYRERALEHIARKLAEHIVKCTTKEHVEEFSTRYECRLFVADVDDFHQLVNSRALVLKGKPRKPLTDAEIEDLSLFFIDSFSISELKAFARAIERAHGVGSEE
jgi:hypothetical protein